MNTHFVTLRGAASVILHVFIRDARSVVSAGLTGVAHTGVSVAYWRSDQTVFSAVSLAAGTVATYTANTWAEISAANMPGWYQLCLPNAAFLVGRFVSIRVSGITNGVGVNFNVELLTNDPNGSFAPVNVERWRGATPTTLVGSGWVSTQPAALAAGIINTTAAPLLANLDAAITSRSTLTAADVWTHATRELTSSSSGGATAAEVWDYATRTLTSIDYSGVGFAVWEHTPRTIQGSVDVESIAAGAVNATSAPLLANLDATVSSRSTLTAQQVWEYSTRTLTAMSSVAAEVWEYATRTLTAASLTAAEVWNHSTRSLTSYASSVVVVSPILTANQIVLIRGRDYSLATGQPLLFDVTGIASLTGATVSLKTDTGFTKSGTVVDENSMRFELTATETAALTKSQYRYQITVTFAGGAVSTPVAGVIVMQKAL